MVPVNRGTCTQEFYIPVLDVGATVDVIAVVEVPVPTFKALLVLMWEYNIVHTCIIASNIIYIWTTVIMSEASCITVTVTDSTDLAMMTSGLTTATKVAKHSKTSVATYYI